MTSVAQSAPRVSVLIATRNRAATLARTLRSLEAAREAGMAECEILVVDNGSTDTTPALLARWAADGTGRQHLCVPQPGKCRALNRALACARAPLLAFTDDDVEVSPQWLTEIVAFFDMYPQYDAAMGRVRVPPAAERDSTLQARLATYRVVPVFDRGDAVRDVSEMYGCNIAVRRQVFARVGNFNERLGPPFNAGEDLELARRILRAGMRIGYMPRVLVYHDVDPARLTPEYLREFQVHLGRGLLEMEPERYYWRSVPRLLEATCAVILWRLLRSPTRRMHAWGRMVRHADILRHGWRRERAPTKSPLGSGPI
ncbi:MAG: glycosyltransferase [Candidatus Binatia bacterium]